MLDTNSGDEVFRKTKGLRRVFTNLIAWTLSCFFLFCRSFLPRLAIRCCNARRHPARLRLHKT